METPQHKRRLNLPIAPQHENPDIASLATLGMRIRKSVADGYSINSATRTFPNAQTEQPVPIFRGSKPAFARVPFPGEAPPSLTSAGSTFQSGLNVSEWGAPAMPMHALQENAGTKRRLDDDLEPAIHNPTVEQYHPQNGKLSFDVDF